LASLATNYVEHLSREDNQSGFTLQLGKVTMLGSSPLKGCTSRTSGTPWRG